MKSGVTQVPLGKLCDVLDKKRTPITKRDRKPGLYPYYGATGVLDYVDSYIFNEPLVLIGEDGAKWGSGEKTAFAVDGKCWVNNHAHVIRPNRNVVLDSWVIYFLNAIDLSPFITGLTVPKLNQGKLREIPIPLPPLPEQKRIVAILDEAFAGIATAVANTEKNLANARELFESYLNSAFTQRSEEWEETLLGDICDVRDGTHESPKYVEDGIPFVTQKNIREEGLTLNSTKVISESDHRQFYKRSNAAKGDVLISMIGVNRGMACLVDTGRVFSIKNVGLVKANENVNMRFILYYLKTAIAKAYVELESRGGAQSFIGLGKLRAFPVVIAPSDAQEKLVMRLDAVHAETRKLEAIYQQELCSLNELKQSLLQKAFSGELTADIDSEVKEAVA